MIQITADPTKLNTEQREAVAAFLLSFPAGCSGKCGTVPALIEVAERSRVELEQLAAEAGEPTTPAQAFHIDQGAAQAAEAFGGAPAAPLAGAPSTAIAGALPTAPAGSTVPSPIPVMGSVPAPSAPMPGSAPAAAAPAPSTPAAGGTLGLDAAGLPWDSRIHSSNQKKGQDGKWMKRRGVDAALVPKVEAELRALMAAPGVPQGQGVPQAPLASPAPSQPVNVPAAPVTVLSPTATASPDAVPQPPAPSPVGYVANPAPAGSVPSVAATVEADVRQQLVQLMGRCSAAIHAKKVTMDEINSICQLFGAQALPLLGNRLDLVPQVAQQIDSLIASRG